jgi:hypothetical protein
LDDIFRTNTFTFPLEMQKQPPSYENIHAGHSPEEEGMPMSKKSKTARSSKGMRKASTCGEVHSFLVVTL